MSRSAFSSSWISRRRSPMKATSPTSLTVSSTCLICLSAISVISFGERVREHDELRIGAASGSILLTTGGSVSRGNCATRRDLVADVLRRRFDVALERERDGARCRCPGWSCSAARRCR